MVGKKIRLAKPLLTWYLEHGLVITRIYTVVEYVPNAALKDFTVQEAEAQLHGDCDPWYALTAEMHKLEGNATYGTLITNKEKHHDIIYVDESEIVRQIISPHFYDVTQLPDGYYEVERTKPSININIPIHVGIFILNYAKLCILELYHDCVDKCHSLKDFNYCEMDNELEYMATSGDSFEELIKPELREGLKKDKHNWFVTALAPQGKRTPGLFKVKFKGDKVISTCSKSYCKEKFASESSPGQVKFSMKGVNKKLFKNPMPHYESILITKEKFRACDSGIRANDQSRATYKQYKNALTDFYPKQKVLEDECSTIPLEL